MSETYFEVKISIRPTTLLIPHKKPQCSVGHFHNIICILISAQRLAEHYTDLNKSDYSKKLGVTNLQVQQTSLTIYHNIF